MEPSWLSHADPAGRWLRRVAIWLDGIDPGGRRRLRGLRLVTVFALASMAGTLAMPGADALNASATAGSFAIWASVYEAAPTRRRGIVDLLALIGASALGAATSAAWTAILGTDQTALSLLPLVGGAFLVDYLKRYGTLATGVGSMAFIGQAVGFGLGLTAADLPMIAGAALIAVVASIVLRVLGGPSERDADALARCRDFRRVMAARLRRYHDALHHYDDDALTRVIPRSAELTTAWAALDTLVRSEFTETEVIAGYLHTEIRRLYAHLQTVLAIGDSLSMLQTALRDIRDRAALGLVLHSFRHIVLLDADAVDPSMLAELDRRCDRLTKRAVDAAEFPVETRIALLRIGLATRQGIAIELPSAPDQAAASAIAPVPAVRGLLPTTRVAFQAGLSALVIIVLNAALGMNHMLWALAASTYVISSSVADTWSRGIRRIAGTAVGVALGLCIALLFAQVPLIVWAMAALAMVIYSVWMPLRYDVACGAYAFALVVTLAEAGNSSWGAASARGVDTVIGAAIGMVLSAVVLPVRLRDQLAAMLAALLTDARGHVDAALSWAASDAGTAMPHGMTSESLLAQIVAQKTRFAGLRFEGILSRDGDGGALLLLRIDSLIETIMRLLGEAKLAAGHIDPALRDSVAALDAQLMPAFDAVLARLRGQGSPPLVPSDVVVPSLRAYMTAKGGDTTASAGVLLAAALTYTSRKMIRTLADLAAEIDRRNGSVTQPIAR
jgi:uncharacterized membrane protein YccC